jgi:hypothetical protein
MVTFLKKFIPMGRKKMQRAGHTISLRTIGIHNPDVNDMKAQAFTLHGPFINFKSEADRAFINLDRRCENKFAALLTPVGSKQCNGVEALVSVKCYENFLLVSVKCMSYVDDIVGFK